MKNALFLAIILIFLGGCKDGVNPVHNLQNNDASSTIRTSISNYFPIKLNNEWTFSTKSQNVCYPDRYVGEAKWKIIQIADSNFKIMKIEHDIHYRIPNNDTTYWGPDTFYINMSIKNDIVNLPYYTNFTFPFHFNLPKDSIDTKTSIRLTEKNVASALSIKPDIIINSDDLGKSCDLILLKGVGPSVMKFSNGMNCRIDKIYTLISFSPSN